MKFLLLLLPLASFFLISSKVDSNEVYRAFDKGENLTYQVKYSLYFSVPVAEIQFSVAPEMARFAGQNCVHLKAKGRTYGFYDPFFKVRDYFNAYVEAESFNPRFFARDIREGAYRKKEHYVFYPEKQKVKTSKGKEMEIPANTRDILSVWYLARSFDYSKMKKGDSLAFHTFIEDKAYPIGLKYLGREVVKTSAGNFECYKLKPTLIAGEIFDAEDEMTLWVSADENKIPVAIRSGISVGAVYAELKSHENLKHPLKSLID